MERKHIKTKKRSSESQNNNKN